jgi:hypothetical protein
MTPIQRRTPRKADYLGVLLRPVRDRVARLWLRRVLTAGEASAAGGGRKEAEDEHEARS